MDNYFINLYTDVDNLKNENIVLKKLNETLESEVFIQRETIQNLKDDIEKLNKSFNSLVNEVNIIKMKLNEPSSQNNNTIDNKKSTKSKSNHQIVDYKFIHDKFNNYFTQKCPSGILAYYYNEKTKNIEFLLGNDIESKKKSGWRELGGKFIENYNKIFDTAADKFSRETCGVLNNELNPSVDPHKKSMDLLNNIYTKCFPEHNYKYKKINNNILISEHSIETYSIVSFIPKGRYVLFILPISKKLFPDPDQIEESIKIYNRNENLNPNLRVNCRKFKWFTINELRNLKKKEFFFVFYEGLKELLPHFKILEELNQNNKKK